jgi:hypothetical protein
LNLEPESKESFSPVHSSPAISSTAAEPGSKSLWNEAYQTLRKENPKIIDAYEKDLLASQNSNQQGMLVRIGFLLVGRPFVSINRNHPECKNTYVDASNKRTLADRGDIENEEAVDREEQLQQLVTHKLKDIENSRLKITVGGKEVVVKELVGKIVRAVISTKDFISSTISAEPHAALAWAGVLVILPVSVYLNYLCEFSAEIKFSGPSKPSHAGQ